MNSKLSGNKFKLVPKNISLSKNKMCKYAKRNCFLQTVVLIPGEQSNYMW